MCLVACGPDPGGGGDDDPTDAGTDGIVVDDDLDDDGIPNAQDNCPQGANPDQMDIDGDGPGDVCDTDDDNDEVDDISDNCRLTPNTDQSDLDGDIMGDACDVDDDNDGVLDTADNCRTQPNPDQADSDNNMVGNACQGVLNPQIAGKIPGGRLFTVGMATAGRYNRVVVPSAPLAVTGIPAGSTIVHAWLYWAVIGTTAVTVNLNGMPVTGQILGVTPDTCWSIGQNVMYRADVTSMITGDGTYTITGLPSNISGPDSQGVSLVVMYRDATDPRTNFIEIKDGALYVQGVPMTNTLDAVPAPDTLDQAKVWHMVSDAQPAADTLTIDGVSYGGQDAFPGNVGAMWDVRVDDITASFPPREGPQTITSVVTAVNDCIGPLFLAVEVTDIGMVIIEGRDAVSPAPRTQPRVEAPVMARPAAASTRTPRRGVLE